ncbi:unnamed protein product [Brassica oleracea]|nr:unnamed protein product [Brassica napus]
MAWRERKAPHARAPPSGSAWPHSQLSPRRGSSAPTEGMLNPLWPRLEVVMAGTSAESVSDEPYDHSYCCTHQSPPSDQNDTVSSSSCDKTGSVVTGTFFGHHHGHVSFCLQDDTRPFSHPPLLLLELAVPTAALAHVPVWSMYCNGKKVGFAVKREMTENDVVFLRMMKYVSVGAGVVPNGETLYLRPKFERVTGSSDSEAFHMVNPDGSCGQELSIFL